MILLVISCNVAAKEITVDDDGSAKFTTIQEAVKYSKSGDTIVVYPGTYLENIHVYKGITLLSKSGDPGDTIIQAVNSNDHVIRVSADNASISGFTLRDATGSKYDAVAGIFLDDVKNNSISNNRATNNYVGIIVGNSENNTLINNIADRNNNGISVGGSSDNVLKNNIATLNDDNGFVFGSSGNNEISDNIANSNYNNGIKLVSSHNNMLIRNVAGSNHYGIELSHSSNNTLNINTITSNSGVGVYLRESVDNKVEDNLLSKNLKGIYEDPESKDQNTISDNEVSGNRIGNLIFFVSTIFVIILALLFLLIRDKIDTKKLLVSVIASLLVSSLIILLDVLFFVDESFRSIIGVYWSFLEIPILLMVPAAPVIYGWITRDRIGAIIVGFVPWVGIILSISIFSGSIYDILRLAEIVELLIYLVGYSVAGSLSGYFASKRKAEYLVISIVFAMGWFMIFLSGID